MIRLLAVVVVVVVAGCPSTSVPAGTFGAECGVAADCDGLQCRDVDGGRRCVPPRGADEAGESCDRPQQAKTQDDAVVDELVFFGAAKDDGDFCGTTGQPDLALRFSLRVASGLKITVSDPAVSVGLRAVVDAECGDVVRFGCATQSLPALVPAVPAGDWVLVLEGVVDGAGTPAEQGVRVTVTTIDCPLGYLPFDDDECVGFRQLQDLLRARGSPGVGALGDDLLVMGGVGLDQRARSDGERFNALTESFSFIEGRVPRVTPGIVVVGDDAFAIGGNAERALVETILLDAATDESVEVDSAAEELFDLVFLAEEVVAVTDEGFLTLSSRPAPPQRCDADVDCRDDEQVCIDERCVCIGLCDDNRRPVTELVEVTLARGTRAAATGLDSFVLLGAEPGVGFRPFLQIPFGFAERRAIPALSRRDAGLSTIGRFVYVFGGVVVGGPDDGATTTTIERLEASTEEVVVLPTRLPKALSAPRVAILRERFVVLFDQGDEPLLFDSTAEKFVPLPPLPIARRGAGLFTDRRDGALFVGGFAGAPEEPLADVQRLELVPRNARSSPPPDHCAASELPLTGETLAGSTEGAQDRFRDNLCAFNAGSGDEHWTFTLAAPRSVQIVVTPTDSNITALRVSVSEALCEESSPVVACDVSLDGVTVLFIAELPAGTYFVSIEGVFRDDPELADGRNYTIAAQDGAPEACVGDDGDPVDDVPLGARELLPTAFADFDLTGGLCPGDVDHVLIQHFGGSTEIPVVTGLARAVLVAPAFIDEPASIAAGDVVVDGVGEFVSYDDFEAGAGFYVLQLGPVENLRSRLAWSVSWAPGCSPDASDSLVPGLDDAVDLTRAARLAPGQQVQRAICHAADRDVVVFQSDRLGEMFITVSDVDVDVELFAFDPVAGVLGAPLAATVSATFTSRLLVLPPSTASFALRLGLGDATPTRLNIGFDVGLPGDRCETADPLPGASGTLGGASFDYRDDLNAQGLGDCTGFTTPGEDRVLALTLANGETLEATLTPRGAFDTGLYLLSACPAAPFDPVCVVGEDQGGRNDPDSIAFTNDGAAGTFFLVVDSFFGESYEYDLTWSIE